MSLVFTIVWTPLKWNQNEVKIKPLSKGVSGWVLFMLT